VPGAELKGYVLSSSNDSLSAKLGTVVFRKADYLGAVQLKDFNSLDVGLLQSLVTKALAKLPSS
jgi:hypothetical protein